MKKIFLAFIVLIILSGFACADLGDFPDNFFKGDKFNGYIVVGKDGTSVDVISQSLIGMRLNLYKGVPQAGINKLDDEASLGNNLILIGNPCVNALTAELLDEPEPCDRDFPSGKAFIKYYEADGSKYIVVAGNYDKGTKKAAEYLADFAANSLQGDEIVIGTEETPEAEGVIIPPNEVIAPMAEEEKEDIKEVEPADIKETNEEPAEEVVVVQDKGFFSRIFDWFLGLFGK